MALWLQEKDAHNSTLQTLLGERGLLLEEKDAHNATLQQLVAEQQKVCDEKEKRCQMLERLLEKERRCHLLEKEMAERHLQPLRAETPWQDQLILPHSRLWNTHPGGAPGSGAASALGAAWLERYVSWHQGRKRICHLSILFF